MNIQGWFPLGSTGLISLLSKESQEFFLAPQFKIRGWFMSMYGKNHYNIVK